MTTNNPQQKIPIHHLKMETLISDLGYSESIFSNAIDGLTIYYKGYSAKGNYALTYENNCAVFLIVLKGSGLLRSDHGEQLLKKESLVVLPNKTRSISIVLDEGESLHFLEFTKVFSEADKRNLKSLRKSSAELYAVSFQDCEPYTEKIKSPNTISRTVLPNDIIPRVALGTVEALGPDKVGEHSHPMLEQLFLGLEANNCTVYADNASCKMSQFSLLHIPLGSTHWVEVAEGAKMNYMWMDFFLTKEGEVWLDTHKHMDQNKVNKTTA